jgi:hypothetical protein
MFNLTAFAQRLLSRRPTVSSTAAAEPSYTWLSTQREMYLHGLTDADDTEDQRWGHYLSYLEPGDVPVARVGGLFTDYDSVQRIDDPTIDYTDYLGFSYSNNIAYDECDGDDLDVDQPLEHRDDGDNGSDGGGYDDCVGD